MAVQIKYYDQLAELIGDGSIDLDAAAHMYHMLVTNGFVFDATETLRSEVTEELTTGDGYTQTDGVTAGEIVASPTWTPASPGVIKFDAADTTWAATGAGLTASDVVVFDTTPAAPLDPLCFSVDFDGDQVAGAGTNFLIAWNAGGIFTSQFTDA